MKRFLIIFIAALMCANTYGQDTYAGKIIYVSDPRNLYVDAVFGLQTGSDFYILSIDSHWISYGEELIIEDTEYFIDDKVVITGTTSIKKYSGKFYREYLELEIETIEKLSPERNIQQFFGTYEIDMDCSLESPWWSKDCAILKIIAETYYEPTTVDVRLSFYSQEQLERLALGTASVLNDDSFIFNEWGFHESGRIEEYHSGKGHLKNDSIFIHYKIYRVNNNISELVTDCYFKGKKTVSLGIASPSVSDKNTVYFDVAKQAIIIDETLHNQFLTFELINMQGSTILKKTNISESINIAHLPSGIYLCRILQNGRVIYSDKIFKK